MLLCSYTWSAFQCLLHEHGWTWPNVTVNSYIVYLFWYSFFYIFISHSKFVAMVSSHRLGQSTEKIFQERISALDKIKYGTINCKALNQNVIKPYCYAYSCLIKCLEIKINERLFDRMLDYTTYALTYN